MKIHKQEVDVIHAGEHDPSTMRYVPLSGGSRSALPITKDPKYPRYVGFVGMDERLTENISKMAEWYGYLGGRPKISTGAHGGLVRLMFEEVKKRQKTT